MSVKWAGRRAPQPLELSAQGVMLAANRLVVVVSRGRVRMDRDRFWALVKASRQPYWDRFSGYGPAECEAHAVALTQALAELPAEEIIAFDRILDQLVWREAYSWDLWGAAYLLNGGCSDDCFVYFRYWLVGQGRLVFETAVRDPDSLAELPFVAEALTRSAGALDPECEELMYAARQAYDQATRNELPTAHLAGPSGGPAGNAWDFEDHQGERRLPRLWALRYGPGSRSGWPRPRHSDP
jgi:Protein of unknown function (DUF4240)